VSRIWLAANGGNGTLETLLKAGHIPVDRIKVGSWIGEHALIVTAAAHPVLLHISDGVAWPRSNNWIKKQVELTLWLRTPWVSAHLEMGLSPLNYHWPPLTLVPAALAKRWAVNTLQSWAIESPVPLLVENMPRSHTNGHDYQADPLFISQVVEESSCRFLLDLAHARVSAAMRQQPIREYLTQLPLHRLVEIHVSGPRPIKGGRLVDAHQSLQEQDYSLLKWVLSRARPQAVTLEYWRDATLLQEQLLHLRRLLDTIT